MSRHDTFEVREPSLAYLISLGSRVDGSRAAKQRCLGSAIEHLATAGDVVRAGKRVHTAILSVEYAINQIGNAVALVFDTTIENKEDSAGSRGLATQIIVAYCRANHPELLADAQLASTIVRKRNDYSYRHEAIADQEVKRFGTAATKILRGLQDEILRKEHLTA